MSKRQVLKEAIGQTQLLEIIDQAYDSAKDCPTCKTLMEWWEKLGPATGLLGPGRARVPGMPPDGLPQISTRRRGKHG